MGKFVTFSERPKAKSVSASGGASPPDPLTMGFAPGPRWGLRPRPSIMGPHISNAGTDVLFRFYYFVTACRLLHVETSHAKPGAARFAYIVIIILLHTIVISHLPRLYIIGPCCVVRAL